MVNFSKIKLEGKRENISSRGFLDVWVVEHVHLKELKVLEYAFFSRKFHSLPCKMIDRIQIPTIPKLDGRIACYVKNKFIERQH